MTLEAIRIDHDDAALIAALAANRLPTGDTGEARQSFFAFARAGARVGFGGYQLNGQDALIRSIVVEGDARGTGLGSALVSSLLSQAKANGATHAWLLTTDAAPFFVKQGFEIVARDTAPESIATAPQFKGLCPASATFMRRDLDGPA